jgi:hypothetical protein
MSLVRQVCDEMSVYLLNSLNPFRLEGQKSLSLSYCKVSAGSRPLDCSPRATWQYRCLGKALYEPAVGLD